MAVAVACAEKGSVSLWSQLFAEFLALTWMSDHEAGVKKSLPVFGGDFNRSNQSDTVVDTRGSHASCSTDEHSKTVHMSDDVQGEQCSFDLQRMDAVFHEVVMRRLRSPVGYESLGKNKPPLQVEHSSFSDYVKSLKIVGLGYT